jgi:hypothetical protein
MILSDSVSSVDGGAVTFTNAGPLPSQPPSQQEGG